MENKHESFIVPGVVSQTFYELPDEDKLPYFEAIMDYGIDEILPRGELKPYLRLLVNNAIPLIDSLRPDKYSKGVGRKATYPKEIYYHYFEEGLDNKQIADILGMSVSSVTKYRAKYREEKGDD